jgi:hypothetical protein
MKLESQMLPVVSVKPSTLLMCYPRLMEKPRAVPQATGSKIAAAGFSNRKLGSVREGM